MAISVLSVGGLIDTRPILSEPFAGIDQSPTRKRAAPYHNPLGRVCTRGGHRCGVAPPTGSLSSAVTLGRLLRRSKDLGPGFSRTDASRPTTGGVAKRRCASAARTAARLLDPQELAPRVGPVAVSRCAIDRGESRADSHVRLCRKGCSRQNPELV